MTTPLTIVGLGGSLRQSSKSRAVLQAALSIASARGASAELLDLRTLNLPMYVPDLAVTDFPAEHHNSLQRLLDGYRRADIMLWASPTYHGTVSGVFKNAIDFAELLSDDARPYLHGRGIGLISINDSTTFAAMRDSAHELRAWLAPTQLSLTGKDFNDDLTISSERIQKRLERLVDELFDFARR